MTEANRNMPITQDEANGKDRAAADGFDWDELKEAFRNGQMAPTAITWFAGGSVAVVDQE